MKHESYTKNIWHKINAEVRSYEAVVIGTSAGGSNALAVLLPSLPSTYPLPIIIAQHLHPQQTGSALIYESSCALPIREAQDKTPIQGGCIYFAPPNYHLLVEDTRVFALSIDEKVNFTRPAIDVLFESAADVYGTRLIGVILTGANHDGARGLQYIKERGGLTVVQDPQTAEVAYMPEAALKATPIDYVLSLPQIGDLLRGVVAYEKI